MRNLADVVLDYLWFIEFSEDEDLDLDRAVKLEEQLIDTIQNTFSDEEKAALQDAARRRLAWWTSEPDEHGFTPRKLFTDEQRQLLEQLIKGRFDDLAGDGDKD